MQRVLQQCAGLVRRYSQPTRESGRSTHPRSPRQCPSGARAAPRPISEDFPARVAPLASVLESQRCRSEEHTSELQSLMRISYAVFCLKKKKKNKQEYDTL